MVNERDLRELAESLLESGDHFLVDVTLSAGRSGQKVQVLLDGDEGVSIDDCARLSRALGAQIEESDLFDGAYTLEVSTPGIDFPLNSQRLYRKNIGRTLKVTLLEGKDVKGILREVREDTIILTRQTGKGKKAKEEEVEIPLSEVNKSIVQISFK